MVHTVPWVQRNKRLVQVVMVLLGGGLLFLLAVMLLSGITQVVHAGRIMPGVWMAGSDLAGLTPEEAAVQLSQQLTYPRSGQIVFRDGDRVWVATPEELGTSFDVAASVKAAYQVGRGEGPLGNLSEQVQGRRTGVHIQPVVIVDQGVGYRYLQGLAVEINREVMEADLHLNGSEVVYQAGQQGHILDIEATLAKLEMQLETFRDGEVRLVVQEETAEILEAGAEADMLEEMLGEALVLRMANPQADDPGPWRLEPDTLARMIVIERGTGEDSGRYLIQLNLQVLQPLVEEIAGQVDHEAENARFIFNDSTWELELYQPAVNGLRVDVTATMAAVEAGLLDGRHEIELILVEQQPVVGDDATAAQLGITELVSDEYYSITYFRGSNAERMQNIEIAGSRFHGMLIAPGETFSMAEVMGDVSLENGYAEALIIYSGRTIKGVGGGVCQVSTTLFRTAFFGGYPIVERIPHAYRVYYYEQTATGYDSNLAGLDATVYFPLVDLKFTNDRPYWLLMEVYVNKSLQRITWKFYSTDDGRSVDWTTSGPLNVVPAPEAQFVESADIAKDEIKQVDWPADGADVTVRRTVRRGEVVLFDDMFFTHYQPWQAVCEYGSGTEDPEALAEEEGLCQPR